MRKGRPSWVHVALASVVALYVVIAAGLWIATGPRASASQPVQSQAHAAQR